MLPYIANAEVLSWKLEQTGPAKPGDTCGLKGMGTGFTHQDIAAWGLAWI
jgi:hypothetical protein